MAPPAELELEHALHRLLGFTAIERAGILRCDQLGGFLRLQDGRTNIGTRAVSGRGIGLHTALSLAHLLLWLRLMLSLAMLLDLLM